MKLNSYDSQCVLIKMRWYNKDSGIRFCVVEKLRSRISKRVIFCHILFFQCQCTIFCILPQIKTNVDVLHASYFDKNNCRSFVPQRPKSHVHTIFSLQDNDSKSRGQKAKDGTSGSR